MFDLIEHTRNPKETLGKAIRMLAPDGLIILSTPNIGSLSRKAMNKRWIHYKEEHLFYFNRKSLKQLSNDLNLNMMKTLACKKVFYLSYVFTQFEIYKHYLLTPIFRVIKFITPSFIQRIPFSFSLGEVFVVLQKIK